VHKICALQRYYAEQNGIFVPMFRDNLSVPPSRVKNYKKKDFLTLEDVIDRLSRNVSRELPFYVA
jgi:hypothetical protein